MIGVFLCQRYFQCNTRTAIKTRICCVTPDDFILVPSFFIAAQSKKSYTIFFLFLALTQASYWTEIYGIQAYASVNGFVYFIRGIGAFFGSPVGGAILDSSSSSSLEKLGRPHEYMNVIIYDGALLLVASLCVMGVRFFDATEKGVWKLKA